jgi:protein-L-isoaspartate(D-aspartate) O-methyltransferase
MRDLAESNMIRHQVHTWDVIDHGILALMGVVPRDQFVAEAYQGVAFSEAPIKAKNGALLPPAREIGRLLEVLAVASTESIAVVGAESGYLVTLLSQLGHHVSWVCPGASNEQAMLDTLGITNVTLHDQDLLTGWQQEGPYDVVVVMGAMGRVPQTFIDVLTQSGRLFVVQGQSETVMTAWLMTRDGDQLQRRSLFETRWPWLPGAAPEARFIF